MSIHQVKAIFTSSKPLVLLDQAVASGCNFVVGVLLARWLGVGAFGEYSLLWMGVLFLLSLHQAYFTQPLQVLAFSKKLEEQPSYLAALTVLQILASSGIAALALAAFFAMKTLGHQPDWLTGLPMAGFAAATYLFHDFLRKTAFVKSRLALPLIMDGIAAATLLTALCLLHLADRLDIGSALWTVALAYALGSGVGGWKLGLWKTGIWSKLLLRQTAKEHYHFSRWLLGTSLLQWFSGNFFLVAAAGTLGTVALGALRMAQNLVGLCHVLFLAMENTVPAEAARQFFSEGKTAMDAYLWRVALLGAVPTLAVLGGLSLTAQWLINWLYSSEYQPFSYLITAYSVLYVFVYVGYPMRFALRAMQHTRPIFIAYATSAVVSLLVANPVVESWGLTGVMGGLIGTQILMLVVYAVALRQKSIQILQTTQTAQTLAQ